MRGKHAFLIPLIVASTACGAAPTEPVAGSTTPPETATVAVAATPDLSPVAKPASVLLTVRANDVGKSIDAVDRLMKLPFNVRGLTNEAIEKEGMKFVNLDAAIDVVVALDAASRDDKPKFLFAVSVPITSIDDALQFVQKHGDSYHPTTPGAYRTEGHDTFCDLTPSLGESPARAICSEKPEALDALTPWLARGLAAEPKKPADIWTRVDFGPLKEKYLGLLKSQGEGALGDVRKQMERFLHVTDEDLLSVPGVILAEALASADDVDATETSFVLDNKKPEFRVSGTLQWKSKNGWLTQVISSSLDHPAPPPDMYFRLPADATSATWGRSSDPALFTGVRKTIHKGVGAALSLAGGAISDADKATFLAAFDTFPSTSGAWVSASGLVPMKAVPERDLTAAQAIDAAKNLVHQYVPWAIYGGDGDGAQMIAWFKSTADAMNKASADIKKLAKSKGVDWLPTARVTENVPGYPKGSAALDIAVKFSSTDVWSLLPQNKGGFNKANKWAKPDAPKVEAHGEVDLRIVVVPDGAGHMWWGYSTDPDSLKAHFGAVAKGAPASGTIASRTDLDRLKNHEGFGGFIGTAGILQAIRNNAAFGSRDLKELDAAIAALPHHAAAPVFILGGGNSGSTPSMTFDVVAGKDWIEDLGAAITFVFTMKKSSAPAPVTSGSTPPVPRH